MNNLGRRIYRENNYSMLVVIGAMEDDLITSAHQPSTRHALKVKVALDNIYKIDVAAIQTMVDISHQWDLQYDDNEET